MQRDPTAADRARKAERREDEKSGLISMKLGPSPGLPGQQASTAGVGGFKKAGFKSISASAATKPGTAGVAPATGAEVRKAFQTDEDEQDGELQAGMELEARKAVEDSGDSEPESYKVYDPNCPTSP